jgi:uncharacterized protein YbjT (DUF2867 family)
MILVTGAAGKSGQAVIRALLSRKSKVRAFVRSQSEADLVTGIGVESVILGEFQNNAALREACQGIEKIYHICPNVAPDESEIGERILSIAKQANVNHFVYHSVLHPQVEAMPHHWQKMRVEEMIFASGIDFTIIQPCAYMQNVLGGWKQIKENGTYTVPYSTSTRISVVDLRDIGEAVACVLTMPDHRNAIYECCGPQQLSQIEVAEIIGTCIGRRVEAAEEDLATWQRNAQIIGLSKYAIDTLTSMFRYYDKYGFTGNSGVLEHILRRKPENFHDFITWYNQPA